MLYLSQLKLNLMNRQVNRDLANPYELHRTLMRAYPVFDHEKERILFRVEGERLESILVQSTLKPDWQALMALPGYLLTFPVEKEFVSLSFATGQVLRFRLRANPVRRSASSKKREALIKDDPRNEWLLRKGRENGFLIQEDRVFSRNAPWRQFMMPGRENGRKRVTFNIVDFEGVLTVSDPEKLNDAIRNGLGPAKGIGCGLLSVARA